MHLVRYVASGATTPSIGLLDAGLVTPLAAGTIGELLASGARAFRETLSAAGGSGHEVAVADVRLLPPVDGLMEVWAAGVTYRRSQEARMLESETSATVYEQVYDAVRPELFFKSTAWRVCGDGEPISVRVDSEIDVPEPELAVVIDPAGAIVGFTVCNDVSSRTIEGENPLYLPQAKIYLGGCAVGPAIRPAWEVPDPYDLTIDLSIQRAGRQLWHGTASTSELHRRFDDLVEHLLRADAFPQGAILSTGTSLVPDLPFTLQPGDVVRVEIDQVGVLTNQVLRGVEPMAWLAEGPVRSAPPNG